ncbi:MAG: NfeD family protein [Brevundimonas sp.]|uniref:NfeD family protein n=1 Tax=Brevundimonas sp. TaxID=1871086 RepID=UPI00391B598A
MDPILSLYVAQPFWIWLGLGVFLLAIEAAFTTEWLLWPAVSAGVVALMTALGLRFGFGVELIIFAVLTVVSTLASKRLIKRVNPVEMPDINSRDSRLVGQRARVTEAFVGGRGRVFVSGAEWSADIDQGAPLAGEDVVVERVDGGRLTVRPLS